MFPSISSVGKAGPIGQILVGALRGPEYNFGPMAAPPIAVPQKKGTLRRILSDNQNRDIAKQRAPGDPVERFSLKFDTLDYECLNASIGTEVPREIFPSRSPNIDLDMIAGEAVAGVLHTKWMRSIAAFFASGSWVTASSAYEMTPDPKWDTSTGVPIDNIITGRKYIRGRIHRNPNTLILGASAYESLLTNPQILARSGTSQTNRVVTDDLLKAVFKVDELVVCNANYVSSNQGQSTVVTAPIIDKVALLAYIEQSPDPRRASPSAMHTLFWDVTMSSEDATPSLDNAFEIEPPRFNEDKKVWVYDGETNFLVKQTNASAAYLYLAVCS